MTRPFFSSSSSPVEEDRTLTTRASSSSTVSLLNLSSPSTPGTDYANPDSFPMSPEEKATHETYAQPTDVGKNRIKPQIEFQRIRQSCPILSPNSCTKDFCQAGRMIHTNEPRVGRDRPIQETLEEAAAFLRECRKVGVIATDEALANRLRTAAKQISDGAVETVVVKRDGNKTTSRTGANWFLEQDELRYGLRAAWRNSKRCIMRSLHMELDLCDLRHITTSREMGQALVSNITKAFNNGSIQPTVFVFPPREAGKTGPLFFNGQILGFAGYRQQDGTILGDPANADLTDAILELGWQPPPLNVRTRWDLLPLVTVAEDDDPFITELPSQLQLVVKISHPRYKKEFENIDVRWVAFPALSRLGFDIGGVQFTATPFIGWFMDAEIGIRNLADSFRYNMLSTIAKALEAPSSSEWDLDDLPEFERLAVLSRAQTELNYAVNWSFNRAKVMIVDSLTASAQYTQFDDEFLRENGYRLPADPYWLAPPIGSLAPIWHRGGAPNYQPKPLIARHINDPVKVWRRKLDNHDPMRKTILSSLALEHKLNRLGAQPLQEGRPSVRIFYCSSGITAAKLAAKLFSKVSQNIRSFPRLGYVRQPLPLNQLDPSQFGSEDVLLILVSTTGRGEMPSNGAKFFKAVFETDTSNKNLLFSVFGNGDSTYGDTYNAAAVHIQQKLEELGVEPFLGGLSEGDSSIENPPWNQFNGWWDRVQEALMKENRRINHNKTDVRNQTRTLVRKLPTAFLEDTVAKTTGIIKVSLNIGGRNYHGMDHVRVFPPNPTEEVDRALGSIDLASDLYVQAGEVKTTLLKYLREYTDLQAPFRSLEWLSKNIGINHTWISSLREKSALEVLDFLKDQGYDFDSVLTELCEDFSTIKPRVFSAASYLGSAAANGNILDLIVKVNPSGRFSNAFLSQAVKGSTLRYTISSFPAHEMLFASDPTTKCMAPVIAITTGSGIGPVRSLLRQRMAIITQSHTSKLLVDSPVSLLAGYKVEDASIITEVIAPAREQKILDLVELVPSNKSKVRVQDRLLKESTGMKQAIKRKLKDPRTVVFVCAGEMAAEGIKSALDILVTEIQREEHQEHLIDSKEWMGERYVEEVFRH